MKTPVKVHAKTSGIVLYGASIWPHPYDHCRSDSDEFRYYLNQMSSDVDCVSPALSMSSFKISLKDQGLNFQWCSVA